MLVCLLLLRGSALIQCICKDDHRLLFYIVVVFMEDK